MDRNKPLSVRRDEFVDNIVSCVNTSGLPMWTVSMLLKQLLDVVDQKAEEEHRMELEYYNNNKSEGGDM